MGTVSQMLTQWGLVALMIFLFGIFFLCRALPLTVSLRQSIREKQRSGKNL